MPSDASAPVPVPVPVPDKAIVQETQMGPVDPETPRRAELSRTTDMVVDPYLKLTCHGLCTVT